MKNKKITAISSFLLMSFMLVGMAFVFERATLFAFANNNPYGLVMNSTKNKLHNNTGSTAYSGEATTKTNLGNDISFTYSELMGLASTWHVAKNGGYFYNSSPIHGLDSIFLSFKTADKDFKLYWSSSTSFTEEYSQAFTSSTTQSTVFDFNDDRPSYFKFVNNSGSNLNISNVELTYSCANYYPTLTIGCNDNSMGTVSGDSGIIQSGQNVTIIAAPNPGYKFLGWYNGSTLLSTNVTYTFMMGFEDLNYVARFTYETYNLIVETESSEKGTVSDASGSYDYLTPITIEATANEGYTFIGWFSNDVNVSSNNPYTFDMPYSDTTYTAEFSTNQYELNVNNQNPTLGSITGAGTYLYGQSVTLVATPEVGVSFLGWFDSNDELLSSLPEYTFDMPYNDLNYVAKFVWTLYSVTLSVNDSSMGSVTGGGSYIFDQNVTLVATPNEHYSFFGWYNGTVLLSQDSTYTFHMPNQSLNIEGRFVQNHYLYIYSDDETKGSVSYPSEWGEGLEVTITANSLEGYALDYWYDEDLNEVSHDISYTFVMPNDDITLYATFVNGYVLTVTSNDTDKGTVTGGGSYPAGRVVQISLNYISGIFMGWFDDNNNLITDNHSFEFTMPSQNYSILAHFMTKEEWAIAHDAMPSISEDGKTITYGLYPQKNVSDSTLINSIEKYATLESNGWYLYNDEYYAKAVAKPREFNYKFENGIKIVSNVVYWFKCEPIKWNVLNHEGDKYFLFSDILLDVHVFHSSSNSRTIDGKTIYANNYEYSDIRRWLNEDFYNTAFALDDQYIVETLIDNSAITTSYSQNKYVCDNTLDKIFLLSYKEYRKDEYGFKDSSALECKPTDWCKANGANYSTYSSLSGYLNGWYWGRSPSPNSPKSSNYIYVDGVLKEETEVTNKGLCVRPAMILSLTEYER